ncbi:MAG: META domain-containing protein [Gemmatimonadota bacterium]|jgi:heat shock protein HslJ/membrane-bound inhibitor of C-type lysozyme|nr:META domain-containing protein [Gemmatimonadota bacterium]
MNNYQRLIRLSSAGILTLAVVAGCSSRSSRFASPGGTSIPFSADNTFVYKCPNSYLFSVDVVTDTVNLRYGETRVRLPRVESASGERYSEGGTTFWNKGSLAMLETPTFSYSNCAGSHAPNPWIEASMLGYDFRAVGGTTGGATPWLLEIDNNGGMRLTTDGESEIHINRTPDRIAESPNSWSYTSRADSHEIRVLIEEDGCQAPGSEESFPAYVTLTVDGSEYTGCGRSVEGMHLSPLEFNDWWLTHVDSRPVTATVSPQPPGITFDMKGTRIFGFTGCNSFIGPFNLLPEGRILFRTPILTTRVGCSAPDLERLEAQFFQALQRVDRYAVEGGTLTLYSGNAPILRFRADRP